MFGIITRRRYDELLTAATALAARLRDERDQALDERDAFKAAAETAARLVADLTDLRRPLDGASVRPATPSAELLRARAQMRALEQRLAELQAANEARDRADYMAAGGPHFDTDLEAAP
ncbi:hypothetical protein [Streptomyces thermodiastaticus]|jgi:hypothetical protein|uniref:hypothetical protein n=1 Tax=Streptomyces thermodiastaticus TaxID=44061 RepID=UPI00167B4679|nr:hypothetical protein [Streptomyces thermodiastaticus]MCE7550873.1 hypothetical protein [Streptomyces thermodiastaticus]GHF74161.1 hypothetical protein GCM10018787_23600 [Streptomyces thermodiastaticus]